MKNVFIIFVLFLGLGMANAQEKKALTFDETVKYINEKIDCCVNDYSEQFRPKSITVSNSGIMNTNYSNGTTKKIDLLAVYSDQELLFYDNNGVHFRIGERTTLFWPVVSQQEGEKIIKAFKYLISLCSKSDDPLVTNSRSNNNFLNSIQL